MLQLGNIYRNEGYWYYAVFWYHRAVQSGEERAESLLDEIQGDFAQFDENWNMADAVTRMARAEDDRRIYALTEKYLEYSQEQSVGETAEGGNGYVLSASGEYWSYRDLPEKVALVAIGDEGIKVVRAVHDKEPKNVDYFYQKNAKSNKYASFSPSCEEVLLVYSCEEASTEVVGRMAAHFGQFSAVAAVEITGQTQGHTDADIGTCALIRARDAEQCLDVLETILSIHLTNGTSTYDVHEALSVCWWRDYAVASSAVARAGVDDDAVTHAIEKTMAGLHEEASRASGVLLLVVAGAEEYIGMHGFTEVYQRVQPYLNQDCDMVFGVALDEGMKDLIKVSVILAGEKHECTLVEQAEPTANFCS